VLSHTIHKGGRAAGMAEGSGGGGYKPKTLEVYACCPS